MCESELVCAGVKTADTDAQIEGLTQGNWTPHAIRLWPCPSDNNKSTGSYAALCEWGLIIPHACLSTPDGRDVWILILGLLKPDLQLQIQNQG